jgi:hypothetical protein
LRPSAASVGQGSRYSRKRACVHAGCQCQCSGRLRRQLERELNGCFAEQPGADYVLYRKEPRLWKSNRQIWQNENGMDDQGTLGRLHYELIHGLVEDAACPTESELAYRMSVAPVKVEELLHALSAIHGVVLHPCECRPWVIHPFSLTPTINWIEGQRAGWWAPCVWCALGVAALVGGEVRNPSCPSLE